MLGGESIPTPVAAAAAPATKGYISSMLGGIGGVASGMANMMSSSSSSAATGETATDAVTKTVDPVEVALVFDNAAQQTQYKQMMLGEVSDAIISPGARIVLGEYGKKYKMMLYVIFLPTPRMEQQYDSARLQEWRPRADSTVIVVIRYGRQVAFLREANTVVPWALDIVEITQVDSKVTYTEESVLAYGQVNTKATINKLKMHIASLKPKPK